MNKFHTDIFGGVDPETARRKSRTKSGVGIQALAMAESLSKISENEVKEINSDSSFGESSHSSPKAHKRLSSKSCSLGHSRSTGPKSPKPTK